MFRWLIVFALALFFAPLPAHAFYNCERAADSNAAYFERFDARLGAGTCDVIHTYTVGGHPMRLISIHGAAIDDGPAIATRVGDLARDVDAAMAQVGGLRINEVTVLFTNLMGPADDQPIEPGTEHHKPPPPDAGATTYGHECVIAIYKADERRDVDSFVFTLSHEMFHCIQYETWDDASRTPRAVSNWWAEGTAELFGHIARPGTSGGDANVAAFDSWHGHSLLEMDYQNVVFFAWYTQKHGVAALKTFIDAMPTARGSTIENERDALESKVPINDWIEFVEAYLDQTINFPAAGRVPSHPVPPQTITISETSQFDLPPAKFAVMYSDIVFAAGHYYETNLLNVPSDGKSQWKLRPDGGWADPPANVRACKDAKRFLTVWATTRSESAGRINAVVPEGNTCSCLIGSWQQTTESLGRIRDRVLAVTPEQARPYGLPNYVSGGIRLIFNPDATGSTNFDAYIIEEHNAVDPATYTKITFEGPAFFTWQDISGFVSLHATGAGGRNHATMYSHGRATELARLSRPVTEEWFGGKFTCDEEHLHVDVQQGVAGVWPWDYKRISPPPAPR